MKLTSDVLVETIEGEERWVGNESTCALVAGAIDDGCIGTADRERSILDITERDGVHSGEYQWMD